jgi:hypothetical protein
MPAANASTTSSTFSKRPGELGDSLLGDPPLLFFGVSPILLWCLCGDEDLAVALS